MNEASADPRRFPIGQFVFREPLSADEVANMVDTIEQFPQHLSRLLSRFTEEQLDQSYRPGGWSVRQVVHHLADSHMNAYVRFKMALTENLPTIKPYNEMAWAELLDSKTLPVAVSLNLLSALHQRWVVLLKAMDDQAYQRRFFHPQHMKTHSLYELLAMYAWHCNHHYAHIALVVPPDSETVEPRPARQAKTKSAAPAKKPAARRPARKSDKK
ncbi:MAG: putative metal-dependent hydrolase [Chitinophagales bacterium]|nr:putative metal-dependent hydrolase [Chitinophagales bacterium]MDW8393850.1 putative metal-dependent hydrolase [Chitinophagales bacterium]